ncbi:MAG: sulfotransferase [Roseibium sp.]|nr:sulfotransferase [Roseibium sp.]
MLMSLLDGHPECLVYPNEPFFYSLFKRNLRASNEQIRKSFLIETRNSLHCGDARSELEPMLSGREEIELDAVHDALQSIATHKEIRELRESHFPHDAFFSIYFSRLVADLKSITDASPKLYVKAAFSALREAISATRPEMRAGSHPVFKDPLGHFRPGALDWFLDTWPDGKIVFLRRNLNARVWSHIQHDVRRGRPNIRMSTDKSSFKGLCKSYARDRVYSSVLPDSDRLLKIDYEELVTRPRETMTRVCNFLGIEFNECVMRSTILGIDATPKTNRTGSNSINTNSLTKWKDNLTKTERLIIRYYFLRASSRKLYSGKSFSSQAISPA